MAQGGAEAGPCSVLPVRTACSWTPLAFLFSSEGLHVQPPLWVSLCPRPSPFIHSFDACLMTVSRGQASGALGYAVLSKRGMVPISVFS